MKQIKISDAWKKKSALINKFFDNAENQKHTEFKSSSKATCTWCVKFKELDFFGCLYCGSKLK